MRFRITVRGDDIELRGYVDGEQALHKLATALGDSENSPGIALVIASPADDHYNPFALEDL